MSARDSGTGGSDAARSAAVADALERDGSGARPVCSDEGWCWESPLPQGNDVIAVWASAVDDVWMIPALGPLLHWDGHEWSSSAIGASGVDGGAGSAGGMLAIWGSDRNDVWAVGTGIAHWDGKGWTRIDAPTSEFLQSIHGSSARDVWAVGSRGTILHFDGASWTQSKSGIDGLQSVFAGSVTDAWATGGGLLLHFDGNAWSRVSVPVDASAAASSGSRCVLGGSGPGDVWLYVQIYGLPGATHVLHYDGSAWTAVTDGPSGGVTLIAATAPDDVWFMGVRIEHFDGKTWRSWPGTVTVEGGWAIGRNAAWAAGASGRTYVWNGENWYQMARQITPSGYCLSISSMWASASDDAWAVGAWGMIFHYDGRAWSVSKSECEGGGNDHFYGVAGSARDNVWTVGADDYGAGTAFRLTGATWAKVELPSPTLSLSAVWTSGPSDVWAVGRNDRLHFDGVVWSQYPVGGAADPVTGAAPALRALWGTGSDDLWAVGDGGMAARWDGTSWTAFRVPAAYAYDFDSVWGTGDSDVWISGQSDWNGMAGILHWDGSNWREWKWAESRSGVWGTSATDVWSTGSSGSYFLTHWDGQAWTRVFDHRQNGPAKLFGLASTGDIWAFGSEMILHHGPHR